MKLTKKSISFFVIMVLAYVPLFRPRIINLYPSYSKMFYLLQVGIAAATFLVFIIRIAMKGWKAFDPLIYVMILYKGIEIFSVWNNGYFDSSTIINMGNLIAALVLTQCFLEYSPKITIGWLSIYTGTLIIINGASYFLMWNSTYTDATGNIIYFWSTRNHLSGLFFLSMITSILFNRMCRTTISFLWMVFINLLILVNAIVFNSSTTIVGLAVFIILHLAIEKRKTLYKPVMWFIMGLMAHVLFVFFRLQYLFGWIIEKLLQKNIDMSGRTYIWDVALESIRRKPIFGYGKSAIFRFRFADTEIPAHNQFLDISIISGLIGLSAMILMLFLIFRKAAKRKESQTGRILICVGFASLIMMITESISPYQPWYILMALVVQMNHIDEQCIPIVYQMTRDQVLHIKVMR